MKNVLVRLAFLPLVFPLAAVSTSSFAEEDSISTDRPGLVESASVIGKGVFQIETSIAHERDRRDGTTTRTWTTPTLFRYGISDSVELRLETDGYTNQRVFDGTDTATQNGFSNSSLGFKWQMAEGDQASGKPALAWLAHLETNSGSAPFRDSGLVPSLRLVAEWDLPSDAAFGVMPGLAWRKDDAGVRYWSPIFAATYGRSLTANMRGFIELAGHDLRSQRHGGNQSTFDTGVTYALDRDTQIDVAVNLGLNRYTPDRVIAIGFSKRFR